MQIGLHMSKLERNVPLNRWLGKKVPNAKNSFRSLLTMQLHGVNMRNLSCEKSQRVTAYACINQAEHYLRESHPRR